MSTAAATGTYWIPPVLITTPPMAPASPVPRYSPEMFSAMAVIPEAGPAAARTLP
ncbi:hypothetical protein [Streptomyces sp. 3N207]|uniref:hypothetical protein n=1 Tax=Streptomyces sp. 3N207 TaxID=3457417 RepID=UPI003FD5739F